MTSNNDFEKYSWGKWMLDFKYPQIMGIINITPDSFSDGGDFSSLEQALKEGLLHVDEGANILDVGGESSRPGASALSLSAELERVIPLIKALLKAGVKVPISIDTYKAEVAKQALDNGAAIINDIYAGRYEPEILKVAAEYKVPLILMHMLGEPGTMQNDPIYDDVVAEVHDFLQDAAQRALSAGVAKDRIFLDPGIGFGKTVVHNLTLLNNFENVIPKGYKSVMALSRKNFFKFIINKESPKERDQATVAANVLALHKGASIFRVHRVAPNVDALKVALAIGRESV